MRPKSTVLVLALAVWSARSTAAQRSTAPAAPVSPWSVEVKFRLYPTQNIWTFLLLDSSTGRIWQVHYSISDSAFAGRLPLNETALATTPSLHVGRFTLRETQNMYTFLLLDQEDGRVWQVQWANEERNRGIIRALASGQP